MLWLLLVWLSMAVANAQNTERQLRPELDIYVSPWEAIRFEFENPFQGDRDTENWRAHFALYIEAALKPVLRREVRRHPHVYRNPHFTVRAGYPSATRI